MGDERPSVKIKPVIEKGQVIIVEVDNEPLPLKRPIPVPDFPAFYEKLLALIEYVDFSGKSGWTDEEINFFLFEITERSCEFFEILAKDGGWVRRDKILSILKIDGKKLAGTLSSPGQYFSYWRKDPIYEKERRISLKDESPREYLYYRLKPKYLERVREWFEITKYT